jgi:hypothetical protein
MRASVKVQLKKDQRDATDKPQASPLLAAKRALHLHWRNSEAERCNVCNRITAHKRWWGYVCHQRSEWNKIEQDRTEWTRVAVHKRYTFGEGRVCGGGGGP